MSPSMTSKAADLRFAASRPWRFVGGLLANRQHPDIGKLGAIADPERFVWAVLPHAARTFAPSIVALPYRQALPAAVGYLYARILDTYEDLGVDAAAKRGGLRSFAAGLGNGAPPLAAPRGEDERVHLLLVERCHLVDAVFATLPSPDRRRIRDMVEAMSSGMQRFVDIFEAQDGVLADTSQVDEYCRVVIGHPIYFVLRSLLGDDAATRVHDDAMDLSVLIQLANITRDIEKDLRRGIAYHPTLSTELHRAHPRPEVVAEARRALVTHALGHLPATRRLITGLRLPRFSLARGSAVLMALKTDRHYRKMAETCGVPSWRGADRTLWIWAQSSASVMSPDWARRVLDRVGMRAATAASARW